MTAAVTETAAMTERDLVGQLLMIGIPGTTLAPDDIDWLRECRPGGVMLFARNVESPEQTARLTEALRTHAPTPLLIAIDEEGGRVSRLPKGFTTFPSASSIAARHSPETARDIARVTAGELRAVGITMNMAPVLDVNSHPANPVIGDRAFGPQPQQVCDFALAVMEGLREHGVIPCGKHFPGHGHTTADSHATLPVVEAGRAQIDERELTPFRHAIRRDIPAIMTAHVRYPALDAAAPATLSRPILTDLLRRELNFRGVTMTDDMEMRAILDHGSVGEASVRAVRAGADVVLVCHRRDRQLEAVEAIERALAQGTLSREHIEAAVARLRALKHRHHAAWPPADPAHVARVVGHPRHTALRDTLHPAPGASA